MTRDGPAAARYRRGPGTRGAGPRGRTRRGTLPGGLLVALVVAALSSSPPTGHAQAPEGERVLNVHARAWPAQPDPGQQQTSLAMRPAAAEVAVASPPPATFGRASVFDMGFAEGFQQPPEESYVSCDTVAANLDTEAERTAGPVHLAVRCDHLAGTAEASTPVDGGAAGGLAGTARSHVEVDARGAVVRVRVEAEVSGLRAGPFRASSARYRAIVAADGTADGTEVDATVDVAGAEANGVPVAVGPDGLTVDDSRVPAPLVPQATALLAEWLDSPYSDVRVSQPRVEVSPEGDRVTVRGGGVHVRFASSDDPAERYFVAATLVGGEIDMLLGEAVADLVPDAPVPAAAPPAPAGAVPGPAGVPPRSGGTTPGGAAAPAPAAPVAAGPGAVGLVDPVVTRRALPAMGPWWLVVLVAGLALMALERLSTVPPLLPVRRRVQAGWDEAAERYLRG